jgi:phosphoglycerol transferase MdoB-like AlkP superfamily enzyme
LELYRAWGFRIDATPLMYLSSPDEMMASAGASPIGLLIFIWVVISIISILAFHFLFQKVRFEKLPWLNFPIVLFFAAVLIIPIRGGLQLALSIKVQYISQISYLRIMLPLILFGILQILGLIKQPTKETLINIYR